jgi:hypothetical protein
MADILTFIGLYGVYWWTLKQTPDPIAFARKPWIYALAAAVIGWGATIIGAELFFRSYARRHISLVVKNQLRQMDRDGGRPAWLRGEPQELREPPDRLEFSHKGMAPMLLVGLAILAFGVWFTWTQRVQHGWWAYALTGLCTGVSLLFISEARNIYVTLDKRQTSSACESHIFTRFVYAKRNSRRSRMTPKW